MRLKAKALALLCLSCSVAIAAQEPMQFNLVMLNGDGRLVVPSGPNWVPTAYLLLDQGSRTTLVFEDHQHSITLTASEFPNDDGTPEACRDLDLNMSMNQMRSYATLKNESFGSWKSSSGNVLATESFLLVTTGINPGSQQNLYAFAAGPHTCAEIHLTQSGYNAASAKLFQAELTHFHFEADYTPTSEDYNALGTLFYDTTRDFQSAALYYQRALDVMPFSYATLKERRVLVDQLMMSDAVIGQYAVAYRVGEAAIDQDPDYPYYYYNLACIDAELHNPSDAKRHLQLAYDHRANALPGQPIPDPVNDRSLQKLSKDHMFWGFVRSMSAKLPY